MNFLRPGEIPLLLGVPKPLLHDIIIRLPLFTGMSPGEIAELQVQDVIWDYNVIFVWRRKVNRDHPVLVDSETMFKLWQYVDKRKSGPLLLLPGSLKMKVQVMRRIVKRWARKAGLVRYNRITPYTLRHTFCTYWVLSRRSSEGLRRQIGHANLQRLRDYLDFDYSSVRAEFAGIYGSLIPPTTLSFIQPQKIPYVV